MRNKNWSIVLIIAFVFSILMFSGYYSLAQNPGITNPCDGTDIDMECPVDNGIIVLATLSVIYGFIKVRKLQQAKIVKQL